MDDYLRRTLRATGWMALFVATLLLHLSQYWAIVPVLAGVALAVVLLLGWIGLARSLRVMRGSPPGVDLARAKRNFLGFALMKYPIVAVLIWRLVHAWSDRELMAFAAGYLLLQAVIFLRAVGKMLTENR